MRFCEMPYRRLTCEELTGRYEQLEAAFDRAGSAEECLGVIRELYRLWEDMTLMTLCYVRHDMDCNDPFYAGEQGYYDEIGPKLTALSHRFSGRILSSPHRDALEQVLGEQAIAVMECTRRGFDGGLIPLRQEENRLVSRYHQVTANATVLWEGKPLKRSLLGPFLQSPRREVRRQASLALSRSWQDQQEELEELYGALVENRARQARVLELSGYGEMSFSLMMRVGYTPQDVRVFREQVKRRLTPVLSQLEKREKKRLGLSRLYAWDRGIYFPEGSPPLIPDAAGTLAAARRMYTRLSPETGEFISFLLDNGLYDVESRPGKRGGGYSAYLEKYRAPFLFANFNGTCQDPYILCHEGGHSFQGWLKGDEPIRDRTVLTYEAAETHAMAMEFFTFPYMELFFGERAEDYRTMHLLNALLLIAGECEQDEFQELVYARPHMTAEERNALWLRLEGEYFPGRHYGLPDLEAGRGWLRIPHLFCWPFYAIDYALAQVCALDYLRWMERDRAGAFASYLSFCRQTGTVSFPRLVRENGLADPFREDSLSELVEWLRGRLAGY